jgi:hypothetical protein
MAPNNQPKFKSDPPVGSPAWIKRFQQGDQPDLPQGGAAIAAQGISLAQSLSVSHVNGWPEEELARFIDEYIQYAKDHPELRQQYVQALGARDEFQKFRQMQEDEKLAQQAGQIMADDKANLLRVQNAEPLRAGAMIGALAIPVAEGADEMLKFVPYVGTAIMLTEAITGKAIVGLGSDLDSETRILDAIVAALPHIVELLRGGSRSALAIATISQKYGMSPDRTVKLLRELSPLEKDSRALREASESIKAGRALDPVQVNALQALRKAVGAEEIGAGKNAVVAQGYTARGNPEKMLMENQKARQNWMDAIDVVLEKQFKKGSPGENWLEWEKKIDSLPDGPQQIRRRLNLNSKSGFARSTLNRVRDRFYKFEADPARSSSIYTDAQRGLMRQGKAPDPLQHIEHLNDLANDPKRSLDPDNLYLTEGGEKGGIPKGSPHGQKNSTEPGSTGQRLRDWQQKNNTQQTAAPPSEGVPGTIRRVHPAEQQGSVTMRRVRPPELQGNGRDDANIAIYGVSQNWTELQQAAQNAARQAAAALGSVQAPILFGQRVQQQVGGQQAALQAAQQPAQQAAQQPAQQAAQQGARAAQQAAQKAAQQAARRAGQQAALQAAQRAGQQAALQGVQQVGGIAAVQRAAQQAAQQAAVQQAAAQQAALQGVQQAGGIAAVQRAAQQAAQQAAVQQAAAQQGALQGVQQAGGIAAVQRAAQQAAQQAAAQQAAQQAAAQQALVQGIQQAAQQAAAQKALLQQQNIATASGPTWFQAWLVPPVPRR